MSFTSIEFICFLLISLILYYLLPKKVKGWWLLGASLYFYAQAGWQYLLLLITVIIVNYWGAWFVKGRRWLIYILIFVNFFPLLFFKYAPNQLIPLGMSFFSFRIISYIIDVYREDTCVEKNILDFSLFVAFFPIVLEGPIERAEHFLPQIKATRKENLWNYEKVIRGFFLIVWGYFLKLIIADRVGILADYVFEQQYSLGTIRLLSGMLAYSVQIYTDFLAYTRISLGIALTMGIELTDNFRMPYFSRSIKEFWRRWHISLSSWLKDYIYIPLGGNRCTKMRKYCNLMITFLISGLWHGNGFKFVFWGGLHGAYQIIGDVTKPIKERIGRRLSWKMDSAGYKLGQMITTYILVSVGWIFFKAGSLKDSLRFILGIFKNWDFQNVAQYGIWCEGFASGDMMVALLGLGILVIMSMIRNRYEKSLDELLISQPWVIRFGVLFLLFVFVVVFGKYGMTTYTSSFVYTQF